MNAQGPPRFHDANGHPAAQSPGAAVMAGRPLALLTILVLSLCGCTCLSDYVHNGFKVGPNYQRPLAPVAERWIDAGDKRVRSDCGDDSHWWTVFGDPVLDDLVQTAYRQNLSLREAGFRVLARRAELCIAVGELFPQTQVMNGDYQRVNLSANVANRFGTPDLFYSQWDYGFGMAWELDFWGRFRRAVEAAGDELNATVEDYDDVLVTLVGDVASEYVTMRTLEQRIAYARENVTLQRETLAIAQARFKGGQANALEVNQAKSDLKLTEALIPQLQISHRQANNRLCRLLGIPPEVLLHKFGDGPIPTAPEEVSAGIPADLLRRRPDVRKAERETAAACARIGIAVAELYPQISVTGQFGWSAEEFKQLFESGSFRGSIGPSFRWNILNYGRLLSNVRAHDAQFQEQVAKYQNTVLQANEDVENGLVRFLRAQERAKLLDESMKAELAAVRDAVAQYKGGLVTFNWVTIVQERLVTRQELYAEAQGNIALGLIQTYRALGGGWQIRCDMTAGPTLPVTQPVPEIPEESLSMPQKQDKPGR